MKARRTNKSGGVVLEFSRGDEPLLAAASGNPTANLFRLKKILVPIDFSDCSKKALQYAIPLAKEHGAAIILLYVVPPAYVAGEYGGIEYAQLQTEMKASGDAQLQKLAAAEVPAGLFKESLVGVGVPASEIVQAAKTLAADVIVIATHGRTGLKHVLLGSVVESVVRRAPCPVLVVREREHEFLAN